MKSDFHRKNASVCNYVQYIIVKEMQIRLLNELKAHRLTSSSLNRIFVTSSSFFLVISN